MQTETADNTETSDGRETPTETTVESPDTTPAVHVISDSSAEELGAHQSYLRKLSHPKTQASGRVCFDLDWGVSAFLSEVLGESCTMMAKLRPVLVSLNLIEGWNESVEHGQLVLISSGLIQRENNGDRPDSFVFLSTSKSCKSVVTKSWTAGPLLRCFVNSVLDHFLCKMVLIKLVCFLHGPAILDKTYTFHNDAKFKLVELNVGNGDVFHDILSVNGVSFSFFSTLECSTGGKDAVDKVVFNVDDI
jgi:hypothetical protein